jgi:ABC-2 type transport system permease protein
MLPQAAQQKMANFTFTERILYDPLLGYPCYVIYFVELYMIQMFYVFFYLLPLLVEEKKALFAQSLTWKEIKPRCKNLLARLGVMGITISVSSFIGFSLCNVFYILPLRGSVFIYFVFMAVFLLALTAVSLAISYFINERGAVYCAEIYLITGLVVILTSGAVWPEYMMPDGMPQMIKILWPYIHAALPFRFFNLKGLGWDMMLSYLWNCLVYAFGWLAVGVTLYSLKIHRRKANLHEG